MLEQIKQLPNGARFYKCDLHTHTPADKNFNCEGYNVDTEVDKQEFGRRIVEYARKEVGLDVLGITDHNTVEWIPYIQKYAEEMGLVIFPGVELGAQAGKKAIHFIALFNPGTSSENIDHWISSLGLTPEMRFHEDGTPKIVQKSTEDLTELICQEIDSLPGVVIAAHASSNNGLFQGMEGEGRVLAYKDPRLLAVEIPGKRDELGDFERNLVNGELDVYGTKRVACLNHSDGRCIGEGKDGPAIGCKVTYVKMSTPTIFGLHQAYLDYESRIRLEGEIRDEKYPRLVGVNIEGGFLDGHDGPFQVHFNPNLNCVIGGRGSGKSALLEAVRHGFDIDAKTEANKELSSELIASTLGPGSEITLFYETEDGTMYRIERLSGKKPRVFDAITNEEKLGLEPSMLLPTGSIEMYGQKEIYEISKDPEFQIRLLDSYVTEELQPIEAEEKNFLRDLETNAQDILRLTQDIDEASISMKNLPAVREEITRLEKQEAVSKLDTKKKFEIENELLSEAERSVKDLFENIEQFSSDHGTFEGLLSKEEIKGLPHIKILTNQRKILEEMESEFAKTLDGFPEKLRSIWATGNKERDEWQKEYDAEEIAYQKLLREIPDASMERYMELRGQLTALENKEKEITNNKRQRTRKINMRKGKLNELRSIRKEKLFKVRNQKANELNTLLGDAISVGVKREGNRDSYIEYLWENRSGLGVAKTVFKNIAETSDDDGNLLDPIDLVAAIRKERENPSDGESLLVQAFDVSLAYRNKLALIPDEVLYMLEVFRIPDLPIIELRVGDQYKPLSDLSVGQKCTAILSLILVDRTTPLIIDQPEDDLDNRFIFNEIVSSLRREKERRQFIVATHNANIPVSGDAEMIIVLDADEEHGWIDCIGSIDDQPIREPVETILEGGPDAFRIRKEKYGA